MKHLHRTNIAVLVVGCTLIATTGLAYAGALPGAAQSVASAMLAKLGVTVPGPNAHAGTHPGSRGQSATAPTGSVSTNSCAGLTGLDNAICHVTANNGAHPNDGLATALSHLQANKAKHAANRGAAGKGESQAHANRPGFGKAPSRQ